MVIITNYDIGERVSHPDDGAGTIERIEADVAGGNTPVIMYHIKFDNGEEAAYFEFDIEAV